MGVRQKQGKAEPIKLSFTATESAVSKFCSYSEEVTQAEHHNWSLGSHFVEKIKGVFQST